jgi:hypothetical protein
MCCNQPKHKDEFMISYDKHSKSEPKLASALVGAPEHRKRELRELSATLSI